jgi:hypothetical protein
MCSCHPNDSGKCKTGHSWFRLAWAKVRSCLQNNQSEKGQSVAQVVVSLLSKREDISSSPSTNQQTNKIGKIFLDSELLTVKGRVVESSPLLKGLLYCVQGKN